MLLNTFRKLYAMMRRRERNHFYLLLILVVASALFDMIGVAAIVPFLTVLSDPNAIGVSPFLSWAFATLNPNDVDSFLMLFGFGIFALIIVGSAFKACTVYALARFSHMQRYEIGQRLLSSYLRQPYTWFLARHSSDLVKTVITEVDQMVGMTLVPMMRILAQTVSMLFLLALLLALEPIIAISVFCVIGGIYLIIFLFVRHKLSKLGYERVSTNTARFRVAGEALGGIKEVKIMGLESSYMNRYRGPSLLNAKTLVNVQMIGEMPRYVLEATTFGGIVVLILTLLEYGGGVAEGAALESILPVLGLFAVAGLRMLPALQNIFHSLTSLRAGQAVLDVIHDDLLPLEGSAIEQMPLPGVRALQSIDTNALVPNAISLDKKLELREASFCYPGEKRRVLDCLDISIPVRTSVGLVGGTGAGKTTLIDVLMGLLPLDGGGLYVDGVQIDSSNCRAWQDRIGYVPQQIFLIDDTVAANIAFGVPQSDIDMEAVYSAAKLSHLDEFIRSELIQGYQTRLGERGVRLSGGQRQRIGIARALYHDPSVLIFDEATSALDTMTEDAIIEAVESLANAKTIIMIAHRLTTVENCDQIFLLERGRVADAGSYNELISRNATFRSMSRSDPSKDREQ